MNNKRRQLKWNMITMLTVCWFLPLMLLSVIVFFLVDAKVSKQLEYTIITSADKAVAVCQMRMDEVMEASKNASYIPSIKDSYSKYKKDNDPYKLRRDVSLFMSQQYKYNKDINMAVLYFTEEPDEMYWCYSGNNSGGSVAAMNAFSGKARKTVQKRAEEIDTAIEFMDIKGRIYLVRNIMDAAFHPYAVIVMELNMDNILKGMDSIWGFQTGDIFIDGKSMIHELNPDVLPKEAPERMMKRSKYCHSSEGTYVCKRAESNRHQFTYLAKLDSTAIIDEMDTVKYMFLLLVVFMVPLFFVVFWFFHKHVNIPIGTLRAANKEIEKEHYGYQIDLSRSDEEFYDLGESFNSMSNELKNQFEKIYLEELALKDANIMALQSQINPHFLNNTLEIINWEARMTGNFKVSGMIEALSTMLEATMNRKREQLIPLSEELSYVEAYLYIITQRFGDNFAVEKEIDESLLRVKVPRLIIQPIIENAVEHGMDFRRQGKIRITIRREDDKLLIEIMDNGRLTDEDRAKIDRLLNAENTNEAQSLSLGIRNVNKRLKIIYGPECGLTIKSDKNDCTVSTIMVKIDKAGEQ